MYKINVPAGCRIEYATAADTQEILNLYHAMIGGAAGWSENYPAIENIKDDLSRDALLVMRNETDEIVAAISIDKDPETDALTCWDPAIEPAAELARLCVREDMRGRSIARTMMLYVFDILRVRGYRGVHILVRPKHRIALASYTPLGYRKVGECSLFDHDYICMEMPL